LSNTPTKAQYKGNTKSTLHDYERAVDLNAIKSTACQAVNLNAGGSRKLPIKHTWYHPKPIAPFKEDDEASSEDAKNERQMKDPGGTKEIRENATRLH
jgi:hypothetical protein